MAERDFCRFGGRWRWRDGWAALWKLRRRRCCQRDARGSAFVACALAARRAFIAKDERQGQRQNKEAEKAPPMSIRCR